MSALPQASEQYLSTRQALGFKLRGYRSHLCDFVAYVDQVGATTITSELALAWATKPPNVHPYTWTVRLSMVSGFARYLKTLDPACEVPPADLLTHRRRPRPEPYLYSDAEVMALLDTCGRLSPPLRAATYRTLFGLLAVSGLRVGEAIHLDRDDVDLERGLLVVWQGKFRKSREVPLPSRRSMPTGSDVTSSALDGSRRASSSPPLARGSARAPSAVRSRNWSGGWAWSPSHPPAVHASIACGIPSRSRLCSVGTAPAMTSWSRSRCCRLTSVTSARWRRTGTCKPRLTSSRRPLAARRTSWRKSNEYHRPHSGGLLC